MRLSHQSCLANATPKRVMRATPNPRPESTSEIFFLRARTCVVGDAVPRTMSRPKILLDSGEITTYYFAQILDGLTSFENFFPFLAKRLPRFCIKTLVVISRAQARKRNYTGCTWPAQQR